MNEEKISISVDQSQNVRNILLSQGLSESEIDLIIGGEFWCAEQGNELAEMFGYRNYQNILQYLSDGYEIADLGKFRIRDEEVQSFLNMLKESNLTVENALAINQYSNGSNMILSLKRGTASREEIFDGIMNDLTEKLQKRGIRDEDITNIGEIVSELDYDKPVYENYDLLKSQIDSIDVDKRCYPTINTAVKNLDRYYHIDETIKQLDNGLSKARLPHSMRVYRAIKSNPNKDMGELLDKNVEINGYISTSPLYDSSFAKYDEYDTVIELYIPKGTRGLYIAPFSDYDNVEEEVLLDCSNFYYTDIENGVTDKNGKGKNILRGLVLSQDVECYRGIDIEEKCLEQENQSQSSDKENKLANFFRQMFSRILKKHKVQMLPRAEDNQGNYPSGVSSNQKMLDGIRGCQEDEYEQRCRIAAENWNKKSLRIMKDMFIDK